MKITDLCTAQAGAAERDIVRIDSLTAIPRQEERTILREGLLEVYLNGVLSLKLVCTPADLSALVLGHLFSEGRIRAAKDVASLSVSKDGARADVVLAESQNGGAGIPLEVRACGCGENGVLGHPDLAEEIAPLKEFSWEPRWIHELAMAFRAGAPLYRQTHGIHSCYLMREGRILYLCEDIGRHNALDKALGRALIDGVPLGECVLFSSGRIPRDMMEKAVRARVPLLASNAVPTDEAVDLARKYHITLICTARPDGMDIFSGKGLWH